MSRASKEVPRSSHTVGAQRSGPLTHGAHALPPRPDYFKNRANIVNNAINQGDMPQEWEESDGEEGDPMPVEHVPTAPRPLKRTAVRRPLLSPPRTPSADPIEDSEADGEEIDPDEERSVEKSAPNSQDKAFEDDGEISEDVGAIRRLDNRMARLEARAHSPYRPRYPEALPPPRARTNATTRLDLTQGEKGFIVFKYCPHCGEITSANYNIKSE